MTENSWGSCVNCGKPAINQAICDDCDITEEKTNLYTISYTFEVTVETEEIDKREISKLADLELYHCIKESNNNYLTDFINSATAFTIDKVED